jgi:organic hydroperoxide reductase OsmC/OhrA
MSDAVAFELQLEQLNGYEFKVRFDAPGVDELLLDEPPPLGGGAGPNAARLIAAGVANCLSASLLFCLQGKFKQHPGPLHTTVRGELTRNQKGRMRIGRFDVTIHMAEAGAALPHLDRCLAQFEDFCTVTESVRRGIPVAVRVVDAVGAPLFEAG